MFRETVVLGTVTFESCIPGIESFMIIQDSFFFLITISISLEMKQPILESHELIKRLNRVLGTSSFFHKYFLLFIVIKTNPIVD